MVVTQDCVEFDPQGDVILILSNKDEGGAEDIGGTDSTHTDRADGPPDVKSGTRPGQVRMRVSSRHLILVSPFFRALLESSFAEGLSLTSAGTAEVPLPEDDPQALQILLNIIHGHMRKVPRSVNIGTLTQVSVLIDKYALHEVTEVFTEIWFDKLEAKMPATIEPELSAWLCVSWVLQKKEAFWHLTRLAMREDTGSLAAGTKLDLPIPASVFDAIETARQTALRECYDMIYDIQEDYLKRVKQCEKEEHCDALVLGGLLRALHSQDLMFSPDPPSTGLSFKTLSTKLREMSIPTLCGRLNINKTMQNFDYDFQIRVLVKGCPGPEDKISASLLEIEKSLQGLWLK